MEDLPTEKRLLLLREPGFLAAMEAFLAPAALKKKETAMLALKQLDKLIFDGEDVTSDVNKECVEELFESLCFAAVLRAYA